MFIWKVSRGPVHRTTGLVLVLREQPTQNRHSRSPNRCRVRTASAYDPFAVRPVPVSAKAPSNDANVVQVNCAGMAMGVISIPNRCMHSPVQMISLDDMQHAADLLACFAENLGQDADFTPSA